MNILVLNSGSSSVKYKLFDMSRHTLVASGVLEQIGERHSHLTYHYKSNDNGREEGVQRKSIANHREALELIFEVLRDTNILVNASHLDCIGHRVVHGGSHFHQPVLIDDAVKDSIRKMIAMAPLHNPANLAGIEVTQEFAPRVPQVAVFDTAFHHSIPRHAHLYALPYQYYEQQHVRRYGFHGISHQHASQTCASLLKKDIKELKLISLHLGNGASITAIDAGKSIDTSMGVSPLEGLVMGTRSGDIDPSIPFFMNQWLGMDFEHVENILNHESGLKGICGINDMREIQQNAQAGDERAQIAIDVFCYRIKKYIGAYSAILGKIDAVIFTGGIGENAAAVREQCCRNLGHIGIVLDHDKNNAAFNQPAANPVTAVEVQHDDSDSKIIVVRCNEELEIARQCVNVVSVD